MQAADKAYTASFCSAQVLDLRTILEVNSHSSCSSCPAGTEEGHCQSVYLYAAGCAGLLLNLLVLSQRFWLLCPSRAVVSSTCSSSY